MKRKFQKIYIFYTINHNNRRAEESYGKRSKLFVSDLLMTMSYSRLFLAAAKACGEDLENQLHVACRVNKTDLL